MPQVYGGEKEWKEHFEYLKHFFDDERYIKIDNKPVLVLYKAESITDCEKMIAFFNMKCIECGYAGIYVIEERNAFQKKKCCANSDAILDFEPMYTVKYGRSIGLRVVDKLKSKVFNKKYENNMLIYSYDKVWKSILRRAKHENVDGVKYLGAFVDWDNSARKKKNSLLFYGATPAKFMKYMKSLVSICNSKHGEYVFINAWNEWAEGTYLEPDQRWELGYLKGLCEAVNTCKVSKDRL